MKTIINDATTKREYPWVGKRIYGDSTTIVLFTSKNTGTRLYADDLLEDERLDRQSDTWNEHRFEPTSITLSSL